MLKDLVVNTRIIEELFGIKKNMTTSDLAKKIFTIDNNKELKESDILIRRQMDKLVKEDLLLKFKLNKKVKYGYFVNYDSILVEHKKTIKPSTIIFLDIGADTFFFGYL